MILAFVLVLCGHYIPAAFLVAWRFMDRNP